MDNAKWQFSETRSVFTLDPPVLYQRASDSKPVALRWVQVSWSDDGEGEPLFELRASSNADGEGGSYHAFSGEHHRWPGLIELFTDLIEQTKPKETDTVDKLLSAYDEWKTERTELSERDGSMGDVSSSEWQASDDQAFDLLQRLVATVRPDPGVD